MCAQFDLNTSVTSFERLVIETTFLHCKLMLRQIKRVYRVCARYGLGLSELLKKKKRKDDLALAYARLNAAATDFFVNWLLKVSENLV